MVDFASLVLGLDSRQVSVGIKELDKLTAAGKKAEDQAKGLGRAAGPGLGAIEASAKRAGVSVEEFRARMARASESVAKNFPMMGKAAETAAKGVTGLTEALGGAKGGSGDGVAPAAERAERSSRNLAETLTRRFVVGYAVSQIRTLGRALKDLVSDTANIGDLGSLTGIGSSDIQGLSAAAGNKGITSNAFAAAMVAFNAQIPLAKSGIGSLGELLRGNHITVTDTGDAFFKIAELIRNARTDTERESILRQAMLPSTFEWVRLMRQAADSIRQQASDAPKISDAQIAAARRIDDRYNEITTNIEKKGKAAVVSVADTWAAAWNRPFMDPSTVMGGWWNDMKLKFGNAAAREEAQGIKDKQSFGTPLPGGAPLGQGGVGSDSRFPVAPGKPSVDEATRKQLAQNAISREQALLGAYGATTTAMEARRAVELQIMTLSNDHNGVSKERAETLKRLAEEQNLGITAMKQSADAARVEAETIGMSVGKAAEYVAVQTKLNEARRNGKTLTEGNVEAIRREAAALGEAAESLDRQKWAFTNLVQGPMQSFRSSIASGATAMDALKAAGVSALDRISQKLMDMAANNLWEAALGGKSGGGGGLFGIIGSLFGGGGGSSAGTIGGTGGGLGGLFAKGGVPSASSDISRYSNQIVTKPTFFAKGGNVMGEAGPEAVMPLVRTPDGNLGVRSQGGSQAPVAVNITQNNDFRGADPGSEARLRGEIAKSKQEAVSEATQAVSRLNMNAPGSYLPGRR